MTLCAGCLARGSAALLAASGGAVADPAPVPRATVRGLAEHAAELFGVTPDAVMGRSRFRAIVRVRQSVAWVACALEAYSTTLIGRALGARDHSTVINLRDGANAVIAREPEFAWMVERLWAAGECEPMGPGDRLRREALAEALELPAPVIEGAAEADDEDGDEVDEKDPVAARVVLGSLRLLRAIEREHPERVPFVPVAAPRSRSIRSGTTMEAL